MWIEDQANLHGLNCYQEGVIPVRDQNGIWDSSGDISCAYRIHTRAEDCEEALRTVIADLQSLLMKLEGKL